MRKTKLHVEEELVRGGIERSYTPCPRVTIFSVLLGLVRRISGLFTR